jgi:hypothetical protein
MTFTSQSIELLISFIPLIIYLYIGAGLARLLYEFLINVINDMKTWNLKEEVKRKLIKDLYNKSEYNLNLKYKLLKIIEKNS